MNQPVRAVAGLGNPGDSYREDRHNAGWMLLDALVGRGRVRERRRLEWVELTRLTLGRGGGQLWLLRPLTYMNHSGLGVAEGCDELDVDAAQLLVAYDDVDLPLGTLRLRGAGGDGGHRGLRSVIGAMGTSEIPRLRIGIRGEDGPEDTAEYVLAPFTAGEWETAELVIEVAADAVETILRAGLVAAMNEFNRVRVGA